MDAAKRSLELAQAAYDNKTKPKAGRLNIGGASREDEMNLRDATVKLAAAQKQLAELEFTQQK